eukprot:8532166-Pyramimonas_sp.AAC.1
MCIRDRLGASEMASVRKPKSPMLQEVVATRWPPREPPSFDRSPPRWPQNGPRGSQVCPRWPQEVPRRLQEAPKMLPKCS